MTKTSIMGILFAVLFLPSIALAYIDPGTGSIIVQAIIGMVVGASFMLKLYWRRIKNYIKERKERKERKKAA